ncbi:MAG: hypothetical protein ACM3X4_04065 [Ignavibacteriales bacterium]
MVHSLNNVAVAVLISVATAFFTNRLLARALGEKRTALAAPFTEEIAKTVPAVLLHCSILATHVLFGLVEAVYDLNRSAEGGPAAAIASLGGHAVVGGATAWVAANTGSIALALGAGIVLHLAWNLMVTGGVRSGA